MIPKVFWHERSNEFLCSISKFAISFCQCYKESECSLPLSWLIRVDDTHIPLTSGTVCLDHSHLVLEYATSDTEETALVQLPTQASVRVLCNCKYEECF